MTPFYFGSRNQKLFGVYDAPQSEDRKMGVVLCYPVGPEYYRAYPACRYLARRLSSSGLHVLRFDYRGTGDSAGEICDATVDEWPENVCQAIDELREMSQVQNIGIAGLRFGCALAACAARRRTDVTRLALWDPVSSGEDFLESLRSWREFDGGRHGIAATDFEVEGDIYTAGLNARLRAFSPDRYSSGLPPTLIMSTVPDAEGCRRLEELMTNEGTRCVVKRCPGPSVWEAAQVNRGMPVQAIGSISEWMSETTS